MRPAPIQNIVSFAVLFAFALHVHGQQPNPTLDTLKAEAAKLQLENGRPVDTSLAFQAALLKWVESRLPENRAQLDAEYIGLAWRIGQELEDEELRGYEHSYAEEFTFTRPSRSPRLLIVPIDGQHIYAFGSDSRTKLLDLEADAGINLSTRDERGSQLMVVEHRPTHRLDLYRLNGDLLQKLTTFAPDLAADQTPTFDLQPSEILIEYIGGDEQHKRTHVLRYRVNATTIERIDPVAYGAADFVDEWLTATWSDMASRTEAERRDELAARRAGLSGTSWAAKSWHCQKPRRWQVSRQFEDKLQYFLVDESAPHRFAMEQLSDVPFESCSEVATSSDSRLDSLVAEAVKLHAFPQDQELDTGPAFDALRDWIESHLPANSGALEAEFAGLQWQLRTALDKAPFSKIDDDHPAGEVGVSVERFSEYPDGLVITADVTVPCGGDDRVYLYRFTGSGWTRVLTDSGSAGWGSSASAEFSMPDAQGNAVFLVKRYPVQCASVWSALGTNVYRVSSTSATSLLSKWHEWVIEQSPVVDLTSDELSMELLQGKLDGGFRGQQPVRYKLEADHAQLVDPIAYSVEDFVHRWLRDSWAEMQARSEESKRERLGEWHKYLAEDDHYVSNDVDGSLDGCPELPKYWQLSASSGTKEDRPIYFLIHERGRHLFTMVDIGWKPFKGCPAPEPPPASRGQGAG